MILLSQILERIVVFAFTKKIGLMIGLINDTQESVEETAIFSVKQLLEKEGDDSQSINPRRRKS